MHHTRRRREVCVDICRQQNFNHQNPGRNELYSTAPSSGIKSFLQPEDLRTLQDGQSSQMSWYWPLLDTTINTCCGQPAVRKGSVGRSQKKHKFLLLYSQISYNQNCITFLRLDQIKLDCLGFIYSTTGKLTCNNMSPSWRFWMKSF